MKGKMIGVDLAKNVFQPHGASMTGEVKFRKQLTRPQFMVFIRGIAFGTEGVNGRPCT